jgi:hypothetical protein
MFVPLWVICLAPLAFTLIRDGPMAALKTIGWTIVAMVCMAYLVAVGMLFTWPLWYWLIMR